jgi:hypothetical protein
MKVCHIGTLPLEEMGSITRDIYYNCIGEHHYSLLGKKTIKADIYILHCFKKHHEKFRNWKPPFKDAKVISLLHSSPPCIYSKYSDKVVTISKTQDKEMFCFEGTFSKMIYPGIKPLRHTQKINKRSIIKIARGEPGKFHSKEAEVIDSIDAKYTLICDNPYLVKALLPRKADIIEGIKINDMESKENILAKHGIYADGHGDFEDTFCIALLEAMNAGLACVVLRDGNNFVLDEVLGNAGIITNTPAKFKFAIEALIKDDNLRMLYGNLARVRAKQYFSVERMIAEWNQLLINTLS